MGYAGRLIQYISSYYKDKYRTMLVGTGDVPSTLRFYENNGFTLSHRIPDFFTDNYDHLIFEEGVQLVDMVYLKRVVEDRCTAVTLNKLLLNERIKAVLMAAKVCFL